MRLTAATARPMLLRDGAVGGVQMTLRGFITAWAALAVVLTGATQLRLPGLPIGPGEVLLAGWILFVGFLLLRGTVVLSPLFRSLLLYWLLAFALLGLGALMGSATGHQDRETASHDSLAFVLVAGASCFAALRWDDGAEPFQLRLARHTFFICTAATFALLVVAHAAMAIGPVRFWYGGVRFAGWAKNPNQMALFALTMPFLGWFLMQQTQGPFRKTVYVAAIGGAIALGLASMSDALRVAWVGTLGTVGGILWLRSIVEGRGRFLFIPYILVPLTVTSFGVVFGEDFVLKAQEVMQRIYEEGEQGEKRFTLWLYGLQAIRQSPLVGFGPGAYSGMFGPFGGSEAHNSYIDWGMSTGVLGILLHVGLFAWCALRALRAGSLSLFAIVEALAIFSLFGYSLRQPIYWLMLVLVLAFPERLQVRVAQRSHFELLHAPSIGALRGKT
jgi:O-antigen ligase